MRRTWAGLAVILLASLPVTALASHNPEGKRFKFEACTYSDGEEEMMTSSSRSCTYDEDGHVLEHAQRIGDGPDVGGIFGLMIFVGLLWSSIPAFMAANIAESRGQPKGAAAAIGFFGGWLGLAFIYFSLKDTPTVSSSPNRDAPENLKNLYATPEERGIVPPKPTQDKSVAGRLRELETLKQQGLVTSEEYETQRKAIISDV